MYTPTLAGFIAWARAVMGVTPAYLPDNSPAWFYAFQVALALVNTQLGTASPLIYQLAVYNLAGDNLINWAPDQVGQTYFADLRSGFKCNSFTGGPISSAGDEGTSESIEIVESLKKLTIGQLQNLKTPYGRQYLAFAQTVGTNWGMS